jgi:asparagine synthase (glutamine-hydrolysing)
VIFEAYHRSRLLRGAGSTLSAGLRGVDNHLANRLKSFHRRGTLPNPDRFYQDDAFASDHYEELLSVDLRGKVGRDESLEVVRGHYGRSGAPTEIHRLMYLDLKMTISDSDLIKVTRASRMAGVAVLFPYLDADLVDFTGRLPGMWKVKGLDKRHLFKRAMQGILPDEILKKKKQGFGLPLSVWLRERSEFRDMLRDVVLSDRARGRGYFNLGFVEGLMDHHQRGAWDHGSRLFLLLMLELWHRAHVDR